MDQVQIVENNLVRRKELINQTIGKTRYLKKRVEFGLVLCTIGTQLGKIMYEVLKTPNPDTAFNIPALLMIMGLLLVIDYTNLLKLKFPRITKEVFIFLCFLLYLLLFEIGNQYGGSLIFYEVYAIALIICLGTQNRYKFTSNYIGYICIVGFIISVITFNSITEGLTNWHFWGRNSLQYGADKITIPRAIEAFLIGLLLYKNKSLKGGIFKLILAFIAVGAMWGFRTRGVIVGICLNIIVYFFYKGAISNKVNSIQLVKKIVMIIISCVFIAITLSVLNSVNQGFLSSYIQVMFDSIQRGIATFLGNNSYGIDISTVERVYTRQFVFDTYQNNFNIWNLLFGYGYQHYIDIPVLQAFFDLGIFGGIFYSIFTIVIPFKEVFTKTSNTNHMFFKLFAIQYIIDQIYCGLPYNYSMLVPAIFLLMIVRIEKRELNIQFKQA